MNPARELASHLAVLLRREHGAMSDFLLALADFDRRRLWQELGHASLFTFLHRELGLSKGASHFRKVAAELIQRFPEVAEQLRDGRLCITSVVELAKVITPENRAEVLPRFFHASKQEAKAIAAEMNPQQAVPRRMVVTALALPSAPREAAGGVSPEPSVRPVALPVQRVRPDEPVRASLPKRVEPLTGDLRRLHMTVSKRFMEKLEAARDALSHSHPGADAEAILEVGLDLVIERAARRVGIVERPREAKLPLNPALSVAGTGERDRSPGRARRIPAAVRREVWVRDGGRCQWMLANGEICGSTHRVQFDHVRPTALGGESTAENLRLACSGHNLLAARRVFGDALIDRYAPGRST